MGKVQYLVKYLGKVQYQYQQFLASIDSVFILGRRMETRL